MGKVSEPRHFSWGHPTGGRRLAPLWQDVWYYHTHLAIIANARSKALTNDMGMPLDAVLNRCNIDPSLVRERVNGFCELR
jgi:hypothetical protein